MLLITQLRSNTDEGFLLYDTAKDFTPGKLSDLRSLLVGGVTETLIDAGYPDTITLMQGDITLTSYVIAFLSLTFFLEPISIPGQLPGRNGNE